MSKPIRILGIDPGSRLTGYGCVDLAGLNITHVSNGTLKLLGNSKEADVSLDQRLLGIYRGLADVINEFNPDMMSIEKVFFAKNAVSALKLGQARGAAVLTGAIFGLSVFEYNPTEVKLAIVGHGRAEKEQVAKMLELILGKCDFETLDSSDGLALAVCHALSITRGGGVAQKSKGPKNKRYSLAECVGVKGLIK